VDPSSADDVDAARRIDAQFNRVFADPVFKGAYPVDLLEDLAEVGLADGFLSLVKDGDLGIISTPIDTLGVNYYHGEAVSKTPPTSVLVGDAPVQRPTSSPYPAADGVHVHPRGLPVTDMDWEIQPEGLTRLLLRLQEEYTGPAGARLFVTENGCAYDDVADADDYVDDQNRLAFYDVHLRATHEAIAQGADVGGYFAWSLLDNFEWAWGYHKRFGIVRVNYETQARTVKASGAWYSEVARTNTLNAGADVTL
jgi:beta-glucosidase